MPKRFQPVQPQDNRGKADAPSVREFVNLNNELARVLRQITDCPLLDGHLIRGIELAAGVEQAIPHGLSRKYQGFIIVRCSDDSTFDEAYADPGDQDRFIHLTPSANTTVDLWVF